MTKNSGKVFLVGAGPGDPGLLTLRGAELLRTADLVLYDGLVNPLVLRMAVGTCERTARTRSEGGAVVPQEEINRRLIDEAGNGQMVVRLKGGDPYIFGRGSEESAALEAAGIPYEVVPGITAATAAGEYAGFSFTHRDYASAVAFVTGHEDPTRSESRLNYAALAGFPGTLVFYMGLGRLRSVCDQLMQHGASGATPASVICRASLPTQHVVTGTLSTLADVAKEEGLTPPSLIVVGDCVRQRDVKSWFERGPLFGKRIAVTRPEKQCDAVIEQIVRLSGDPVVLPLIEISDVDSVQSETIDRTISRLNEFQWLIFTSVNGVSGLLDRIRQRGLDARCLGHMKIAAIGTSTAASLEERFLRPDVVPDSFRAEELAEALAAKVQGKRCLWARASRGRDVLTQRLRDAGAQVEELVVYRNQDVTCLDEPVIRQFQKGEIDWVGLSSPSIARQFARLVKPHSRLSEPLATRVAAISPVTAEAATENGLSVHAVAEVYTWTGILEAICRQETVARD